jgi:COMPASS component SWD2
VAHEIRYLSLFDNAYLRFFTGHEGRVTSLSMSATDDRFLSASVDGTVRLWTLQQPTVRACVGGRGFVVVP